VPVVAVDPEWCVMGVLLVVLVLLSPPPKTFLMLSLIVMVAG